jgi:hypothetical protein
MQLDWEVSNYGFNSRECKYSWRDIRLIALRSELRQYPAAKVGDAKWIPYGKASVVVNCASPIIVERSMYWNERGCGTDTLGGFSN